MSIDLSENSRVRGHVGLFDASHSFGRLFARGKDAIDLLHRMSTNDLMPLEQGTNAAALTFLTNEKGRIIDLMEVVKDGKGDSILITSAGKEEAIVQWLDKFIIMEDARFERATERLSQFLLCGAEAAVILDKYDSGATDSVQATDVQISLRPATVLKAPSLANVSWFILCAQENADAVWNELSQDVLGRNGVVFQHELFELLRIENGTPIAPNELNEKHNPLETPMASSAVSFTKGCYIGQEVIARLDAQQKVQRHLMGLKFEGAIPAIGDCIIDPSISEAAPLGNEIGEITSTAESPRFGAIGLGYVRGKYANPGTRLSVKAQNGDIIAATLVTVPFHD